MIERGKAGDAPCIHNLATALGVDGAADRLAEMLLIPAAIPEATAALANLKRREVEAATALSRHVSAVLGDGNQVWRMMDSMDRFVGHEQEPVRAALVPGFLAVLGSAQLKPEARKRGAECLGRLKQVAIPALPALRQTATATDKALADAATAAIKAIEATATPGG